MVTHTGLRKYLCRIDVQCWAIEELLFFQACPLTQYGHKFELIQQKGRSV